MWRSVNADNHFFFSPILSRFNVYFRIKRWNSNFFLFPLLSDFSKNHSCNELYAMPIAQTKTKCIFTHKYFEIFNVRLKCSSSQPVSWNINLHGTLLLRTRQTNLKISELSLIENTPSFHVFRILCVWAIGGVCGMWMYEEQKKKKKIVYVGNVEKYNIPFHLNCELSILWSLICVEHVNGNQSTTYFCTECT